MRNPVSRATAAAVFVFAMVGVALLFHGGGATVAFADFIACGGEQGAKEAGKMRLEGADYLVRDGDIFHFRFNV